MEEHPSSSPLRTGGWKILQLNGQITTNGYHCTESIAVFLRGPDVFEYLGLQLHDDTRWTCRAAAGVERFGEGCPPHIHRVDDCVAHSTLVRLLVRLHTA